MDHMPLLAADLKAALESRSDEDLLLESGVDPKDVADISADAGETDAGTGDDTAVDPENPSDADPAAFPAEGDGKKAPRIGETDDETVIGTETPDDAETLKTVIEGDVYAKDMLEATDSLESMAREFAEGDVANEHTARALNLAFECLMKGHGLEAPVLPAVESLGDWKEQHLAFADLVGKVSSTVKCHLVAQHKQAAAAQ